MRPPGDGLVRAAEGVEQLHGEPDPEHGDRRYRDGQVKHHAGRHEDLRPRVEQRIGAHHAGHRARGADQRRIAVEIEEQEGQCRQNGAGDVEQEIAHVPERILDIVAEDPQEQHVGQQMHPVRMQERIGDQRHLVRDPGDGFGDQIAHDDGDHAEAEHHCVEPVRRQGDLDQKDQTSHRDQPVIDVGRLMLTIGLRS